MVARNADDNFNDRLDAKTTRTIVISAVVVFIVVVLVVTAVLGFLFRDKLRRVYRRWRLNRQYAREARARPGGPAASPAMQDVALQLQLYAVQMNNANDSSDQVIVVMPGLLSAIGAPPASSRTTRHSRSPSVFLDGGPHGDLSDTSTDETPTTLPGVTIAFGAGASTSFSQSTTTTTAPGLGYASRSGRQSGASSQLRRNPLAHDTPSHSHRATTSGNGSTSQRLPFSHSTRHGHDEDEDRRVGGSDGAEEGHDEAAQGRGSGAVMGSVMVPSIAFSLGYGDVSLDEDEVATGGDAHRPREDLHPRERGRRAMDASGGPRRRSEVWGDGNGGGSGDSASAHGQSQYLVSGSTSLHRWPQRVPGVSSVASHMKGDQDVCGAFCGPDKDGETESEGYGSACEYMPREDGDVLVPHFLSLASASSSSSSRPSSSSLTHEHSNKSV